MNRPTTTIGGASRDGLTSLGLVATLRRLSLHQWLVRASVVLGAVLALGATMAARGAVQPIAILVIGTVAVGCALAPDSHAGLLLVALLSVNWLQTIDDATTPWVLVAGAGLVTLHSAMAAASIAPPAASWDRATAVRWGVRMGTVLAALAAGWLAALWVDGARLGASPIVLIAALALVAAIGSWTRSRSVSR